MQSCAGASSAMIESDREAVVFADDVTRSRPKRPPQRQREAGREHDKPRAQRPPVVQLRTRVPIAVGLDSPRPAERSGFCGAWARKRPDQRGIVEAELPRRRLERRPGRAGSTRFQPIGVAIIERLGQAQPAQRTPPDRRQSFLGAKIVGDADRADRITRRGSRAANSAAPERRAGEAAPNDHHVVSRASLSTLAKAP